MTWIALSLGSNVRPVRSFEQAKIALQKIMTEAEISPLYQTKAVGFEGDDFLNAVVTGNTDLPLEKLHQTLKQIEIDLGRQPHEKAADDRTIDLDLLLYDDLITESPCTLPRPDILSARYVIEPLANMCPDKIHPVLNKTMAEIWGEVCDA